MTEAIYSYYLRQNEPNQSCLLALQSIILKSNKHISESLKWKAPCFSYKKKMFCFLSVNKKTMQPYILFLEGNYLNFPELEQGNRKRMKVFHINPNTDLPIHKINEILTAAISLYTNGTIKSKANL
jgi:hypothetical protein